MGCFISKEDDLARPPKQYIWRQLAGWNDHNFAIRIQAPGFDRVILISKLQLITRPAAWNENYDIWLMPTGDGAMLYHEVHETLQTEPSHIVDFGTRHETTAKKPQGLARWFEVAKFLSMELAWDSYQKPGSLPSYQHQQDSGYVYKSVFNGKNQLEARKLRSRVNIDFSQCVMTVWHRYKHSQMVDGFIAAANDEGWRSTLGGCAGGRCCK